jgi:hypothetical protein
LENRLDSLDPQAAATPVARKTVAKMILRRITETSLGRRTRGPAVSGVARPLFMKVVGSGGATGLKTPFMRRWKTLSSVGLAMLVACGGSQEGGKEAEGPAERAGKKLDEAAGNVKETGDDVGEKVGNTIGGAGEDVKGKLGLDDAKDAGAAPPKDGG